MAVTQQSTVADPAFTKVWQKAIVRYEKTTGTRLTFGTTGLNVDTLLKDIASWKGQFQSFRNPGSKTDRLRASLSRSIKHLDRLGAVAVAASKSAFPPAEAIFIATRYLLNVAEIVSKDYDKLVDFFDDVQDRLTILGVLDSWIISSPQLEEAATVVLSSVLELFGIYSKYISLKRKGKAWKALIEDEDSDLAKAYNTFAKAMETLNLLVDAIAMAGIQQLKKDVRSLVSSLEGHSVSIEGLNRDMTLVLRDTTTIKEHLQENKANAETRRIISWISSLRFLRLHQEISEAYHQGTGEWLLKRKDFQDWLGGKKKTVLWGAGILGSGKTTLASMVINLVDTMYPRPVGALAYIICRDRDLQHGKFKEQDDSDWYGGNAETQVLRSIIAQLVEQSEMINPLIRTVYSKYKGKNSVPTTFEQWNMFDTVVKNFTTTFIIIDGLDEFPYGRLAHLLLIFQRMAHSVQLFITSRPHLTLEEDFDTIAKINISADETDLKLFLEASLHHSRIMKRNLQNAAKHGDLTLVKDIVQSLLGSADGMFLLPKLQVKYLCEKTASPSEVRRSLRNLPKDLTAFYHRTLERLEREDQELAKRILSYLLYAKRRLTLQELRHALATAENPGERMTTYDIPDVENILEITYGLVELDGEANMVDFVHESFREYLFQNQHVLVPESAIGITKACISYLSREVFASGPCKSNQDLRDRMESEPFLDYAANNLGLHVSEYQQELLQPLLAILRDNARLAVVTQILFAAIYGPGGVLICSSESVCPLHVVAHWGAQELLTEFCATNPELDQLDFAGSTALHIAARQGNEEVVSILLEKGASIDTADTHGRTALTLSVLAGETKVFDTLLIAGADPQFEDDQEWTTMDWAIFSNNNDVLNRLFDSDRSNRPDVDRAERALLLAAEVGNEKVIDLLQRYGTYLDPNNRMGPAALRRAISSGHEEISGRLLDDGVSVDSIDWLGNSYLHWAIGQPVITSILLDRGVKIDTRNHDGSCALLWCIKEGDPKVLDLLMEAGADVNLADRRGFTALHAAAYSGQEQVVRKLLSRHADPNMADCHGWTALTAAIIGQHQNVIDLLLKNTVDGHQILELTLRDCKNKRKKARLEETADSKMKGNTSLSGLLSAVDDQHISRLLSLIEAGADVDEVSAEGSTALTLAAWLGDEQVVKILLDYGANVNKCERNGRSPLQWSAEDGNTDVLLSLIEAGAEIEHTTYEWTALNFAARSEKPKSAEILIAHGANSGAADYHGRTIAHFSALYGWNGLMTGFIEAAVDLDVQDDKGQTPLIYAVKGQDPWTIRRLLSYGVDVNHQIKDGCTALHWAAWSGDMTTINLLIEYGADPSICTKSHWTPLHMAAARGSLDIILVLMRAGAKAEDAASYSLSSDQQIDEGIRDNTSDEDHEANILSPTHTSVAKRIGGKLTMSLDRQCWQLLADKDVIPRTALEVGYTITVRDIIHRKQYTESLQLLAKY